MENQRKRVIRAIRANKDQCNIIESPEISPYLCDQLLFDKSAKTSGERTIFSTVDAQKTISTCKRTIKLLEECIGKNFNDIGFDVDSLDMMPKAQATN